MILPVNDAAESLGFYTEVLGGESDGTDGPFTVVRINPDLLLLLSPWGTEGNLHLAFTMSKSEFDAAFERIKTAGIEYGDSYHAVGNMQGPGNEYGAHGMGAALYCNDPNKHLIEIRHDG